MPDLRIYGATTGQKSTFYFPLYNPSDGQFVNGHSFAAGDVLISKDGAAFANVATLPTLISAGASAINKLVLASTEMEAEIINVVLIDQSTTKVWLDQHITIHTGGNAAALHDGS